MSAYVPAVSPRSKREIENDASGIILRYYPHLLKNPGRFPVLDFFDHVLPDDYELDTGVEEMPYGVEGMTWPDGRVLVSPETYRNAAENRGRGRFTVPHECYHGIQHHKQIRQAIVDVGELVLYRRRSIEPFRDPEWQANQFAGAVLMPAKMVGQLLAREQPTHLISTMANAFGVSELAAEVRLKKLGVMA